MRSLLLVGGIGLATIVLAACGQGTPQVNVQSAPDTGGLADGITVTGTGVVSGTPDTLTVSLGVSVKRDSVDAAVSAAADRTTAVIDALHGSGVADADVQTVNYSVSPSFHTEGDRVIPDGYTVSNVVKADLHDLAAAGSTIDAATAAGGDDVQVQGVSFSLTDDTAALAQARQKAFDDAQAKAQQYGDLSGQGLGPAQAISDSVVTPGTYEQSAADYAATRAASTPVEPGQVDTSVTVTVRFGLG